MHDAHFHMTKELFDSLKVHEMQGIANAESVKEYQMLAKWQQEYSFFISAGVHPWQASMEAFHEMKPLLECDEVPLIGEIGLDNVWCDTSMEVQREVFEAQLELAALLKKPVILHTKGMEEEIAERIRRYPNTYLVHWYSSLEHLKAYLEQDCYFTIGPSVGLDEAVTRVAELVPIDRMLIETDGIGAVKWVEEAYPEVLAGIFAGENLHEKALKRSIQEIAKIRQLDTATLEKQLDRNFNNYYRSEKNR